jgi:hypothetical protein
MMQDPTTRLLIRAIGGDPDGPAYTHTFTPGALGRKMRDGLTAYLRRGDMPADEWLIERGYPPKMAASIIDRLVQRGWIEYGVSPRTGWLTNEGREALG